MSLKGRIWVIRGAGMKERERDVNLGVEARI